MTKEIFAITLLALMLAAAIVNVWYLNKLTDDVIATAERAAKLAEAGKWDEAASEAESASKKWEGRQDYTHMVLRHAEIEECAAALNGFLKEVYMKEGGGVKGALAAVKSQMTSIASIERVKLGSIF